MESRSPLPRTRIDAFPSFDFLIDVPTLSITVYLKGSNEEAGVIKVGKRIIAIDEANVLYAYYIDRFHTHICIPHGQDLVPLIKALAEKCLPVLLDSESDHFPFLILVDKVDLSITIYVDNKGDEGATRERAAYFKLMVVGQDDDGQDELDLADAVVEADYREQLSHLAPELAERYFPQMLSVERSLAREERRQAQVREQHQAQYAATGAARGSQKDFTPIPSPATTPPPG